MKVSTKGRYALRLMLDIAENEINGAVTVKDMATRLDLSEKYLERIVNSLVKGGLLDSQRYRFRYREQSCTRCLSR